MPSEYTLDPGTGILDKASIRTYSEEALKRAADNHSHIWLAIGDVDDFKHINDTYGHAYGDEILKLVADTLSKYLEGLGRVGRFGGDEFFFCIDDAEEETVRNILRLSRREIQKQTVPEMDDEGGVTMTIGVAAGPENGADYESLFDKADKALYIGKGKGKNRYIIYREDMHGTITVPQNETNIQYVRDYTLRLAECVNQCMDGLLLDGPSALGHSMDLLMDTLLLDLIAIYENGRKRGTFLPGGNDGIHQPLSDPSAEDYIRNDDLPDLEPGILSEMKKSKASFASGLLVINNINWKREEYPLTAGWLEENGLREAIIFHPQKERPSASPVFVIGSAKPRQWGAEDAHYFMIYANLICCMMARKEMLESF